jgi:uncharacterized OB-fold protein
VSADDLAGAPTEAREFFERCARGTLSVQRCTACARLRHYPRSHCPFCLSPAWGWRDCSGRGSVFTFTVIRRNENPRFRERLPYAVAIIELEEGVQMLAGLAGVDVDGVAVGMPVEVVFEADAGGRSIPRFHPLGTERP